MLKYVLPIYACFVYVLCLAQPVERLSDLLCFASAGRGSHDSVLKEILSEKDVLENITLAFGPKPGHQHSTAL